MRMDRAKIQTVKTYRGVEYLREVEFSCGHKDRVWILQGTTAAVKAECAQHLCWNCAEGRDKLLRGER